jgi:hypothetical protein
VTNYASRLHKLEQAIDPPTEAMHILRVIIEPNAAGDVATEVIARSEDGDRHFMREPGETKDALCERAERAMGWCSPIDGAGAARPPRVLTGERE